MTKLVKRVQKNGVKGLYIKKHEEERERRENFIPKVSFLDTEKVLVDNVTEQMIKEYGFEVKYEKEDPAELLVSRE